MTSILRSHCCSSSYWEHWQEAKWAGQTAITSPLSFQNTHLSPYISIWKIGGDPYYSNFHPEGRFSCINEAFNPAAFAKKHLNDKSNAAAVDLNSHLKMKYISDPGLNSDLCSGWQKTKYKFCSFWMLPLGCRTVQLNHTQKKEQIGLWPWLHLHRVCSWVVMPVQC